MVTIGIPRAALYYYYSSFWVTFFQELGLKVVVSEPTNKEILEDSIKMSVDEVCLPIKLVYGHTLTLKDTDYIFIPRIMSMEKGGRNCPKFLGIPDMIRHSIHGIRMLDVTINCFFNQRNLYRSMFGFGLRFCKNPFRVRGAIQKADEAHKRDKQKRESLYSVLSQTKGLRIALVGHPYLTMDTYININLIEVLREQGIVVFTVDMLPENILNYSLDGIPWAIYWSYEREVYNGFHYFMDNNLVDGVINIVAFACGPDSLVSELMMREAKERGFPFMQLVVDEHTAEAGFITRVEAFVDLVSKRKAVL
jgi:predicted nucleotide-binding protein (sugar kinase/HSP70/actin superfamily)